MKTFAALLFAMTVTNAYANEVILVDNETGASICVSMKANESGWSLMKVDPSACSQVNAKLVMTQDTDPTNEGWFVRVKDQKQTAAPGDPEEFIRY